MSGDTAEDGEPSPAKKSKFSPRRRHVRQKGTPDGDSVVIMTREEQNEYKEQARAMFYHGYNNYMTHALPHSELKSLSCTGGLFELIKIPYVTLIDSLDMLVILGDYVEFRRAVNILERSLKNFDYDVSISVFETTIRLLGGLLSAHLFAVDPRLNIYVSNYEC